MPVPDFQNVPVLVTGGAGFIGSHLVEDLVQRGARVTALDDLSTGDERNLAPVRARIRFVRGDIRRLEDCREAVRDAVYVFHEAALGSVPRSIEHPAKTIDVNVTGTATVFEACHDAGVRRVVWASSSSVYGDSTTLPKREGEEGRPLSPYALSKVAGEQLAETYFRCFDFPVVGLRYFNVFGPRQSPDGPYAAVVPRFFAAVRAGKPPVIYGDGQQSRDFTYVKDVVDANFHAAGAPPETCGRAYNVAPGQRTTILDLAHHIIALHGAALEPQFLPSRSGDVAHSQADSSRARLDLGFTARWTLKDGLKAMAGDAAPSTKVIA
jgi:nucleoside-diphosphate-sugar epimerase